MDWQVTLLKQDGFGRIERLQRGDEVLVRRVACGCRWPGSRLVARLLLRRERAALRALDGLAFLPQLRDDATAVGAAGIDGEPPRAADVLLRSWLDGEPLWQVEALASDFFAVLRERVQAMHARGVCHNDLHKENNVLVGGDGWPRLIDFQLASRHDRRGGSFRRRCREDLRHVHKHERRYAAAGAAGPAPPRSLLAALWRRLGKPVYNLLTRRLLPGRSRGEARRPRQGPWPTRTPPLRR